MPAQSRMRHRVLGLVIGMVGALLVSLPAPASAEAVVPGGTWRGEMSVTLTGGDDVAGWQVGLGPATHAAPQFVIRVNNTTPGEPVVAQVPTWGYDVEYVHVRVNPCGHDGTCATGGVLHQRWVRQDPAAAPAPDLSGIPENPVLVPEETSRITPNSPGGVLYLLDTDSEVLVKDQANEIVWRSQADYPLDLVLARCHVGFEYRPDLDYLSRHNPHEHCELFELDRSVSVIDADPVHSAISDDRIVTDPSADGRHSVEMTYELESPADFRVTHELRNSVNQVVIGPTEWDSSQTTRTFDPVAEGGALPDGTYDLVLTFTLTKGEVVKRIQDVHPVTLAENPPADDSIPGSFSLSTVHPDVRGSTGAQVDIGWDRNLDRVGRLQIVDSSGQPVATTDPVQQDCRGDVCMTDPDAPSWFLNTWDGTNDAGEKLPAGTYTAHFEIRDRWGRWIRPTELDPVPLYINKLVTKTSMRRLVPNEVTWAYNVYGRCSSAPSPGPSGWAWSVAILSLSRCQDRTGKFDWLFRTFELPSLADPTAQRLISFRGDVYAKPIRAGMVGGIVYDEKWHAPSSSGPVWRNRGTLEGPLGWKIGRTVRWDPAYASPRTDRPYVNRYWNLIQTRVTEGNKWDIKFLRGTWTYRAWSR